MPQVKSIAIYSRVSSKQQSTRSQEPDLQRWVDAQDEKVLRFSDKFTGRVMSREGWDKLYAAIQAGKISTVVVWRLDRLGRTASGLTALFDELCERKINLISLKEGLSLSTAAGRMMANVLASVAQFEVELKSERIVAGIAAARAEGKKWGGSKPGKRIKKDAHRNAAIKQLHSKGMAIAHIAKTLSISRPTVYSVLKS